MDLLTSTQQPFSYIDDARRLITALRALHVPCHILEGAEETLHVLWHGWEFWEHGTDRYGNDHDGQRAWQAMQELAQDAAKLTQQLARLWCELKGYA